MAKAAGQAPVGFSDRAALPRGDQEPPHGGAVARGLDAAVADGRSACRHRDRCLLPSEAALPRQGAIGRAQRHGPQRPRALDAQRAGWKHEGELVASRVGERGQRMLARRGGQARAHLGHEHGGVGPHRLVEVEVDVGEVLDRIADAQGAAGAQPEAGEALAARGIARAIGQHDAREIEAEHAAGQQLRAEGVRCAEQLQRADIEQR
ncbi:MAG: hypothetical protein ACK4L7_00040 [Flavobacteriales bacterium]